VQAQGNPLAASLATRARARLVQLRPAEDKVRSYLADPAGFCRDVLGIRLWRGQREIADAVRQFGQVACVSGHKIGKDLSIHTLMYTPRGWRKYGDLEVGDQVFGTDGRPCKITAKIPQTNRPMMRVHFEDGTWIDADERHEWSVHTRERRKAGRNNDPLILETRHMAEQLTVPNGVRRCINLTIDLPEPLELPERKLPLDPYLLGYWLGNGTSATGQICSQDPEVLAAFEWAGFARGAQQAAGKAVQQNFLGLCTVLRELGVLNNKHVPAAYLAGSKEQRLALLQGLLDSDGYCSPKGMVQFCNTNQQIAESVVFLARSLGFKTRIHEKRATLYGKDCGPKWHVEWANPLSVFRVPRKLAKQRTTWQQKRNAHKRLAIVAIENLPDREDSFCIEVDSPDHLYLAGPSMIPTHNSTVLAALALWFYCSFARSRVIITAVTDNQVNGIIWREVRWLVRNAKVAIPGAGDIHKIARSGLKDPETDAEIVGFTSREVEAVAGISSPHLLYLVDEANGVRDDLFAGIKGNMMGGAKLVLIGNPTKTSGEFYSAFTSKREDYKTLEISSLDTPNCTGEEDPIPGLADPKQIEKFRREYGEDSPFWKMRILGKFVMAEEGKIFPSTLLEQCHVAWRDADESWRTHQLVVGLDPAGSSGEGDESAFAVRRGPRVLAVHRHRGLTPEAHLVHLRALLHTHRGAPGETPVVMLDRDGPIGERLFNMLRVELEGQAHVIGMRAGANAIRQPMVFQRARDEWFGSARDMAERGELQLPDDAKLDQDLSAPSFESNIRGKFAATPKVDVKKLLGRSPDTGDAVLLALWWVPLAGMIDDARHEGTIHRPEPDDEDGRHGARSPWDALKDWE